MGSDAERLHRCRSLNVAAFWLACVVGVASVLRADSLTLATYNVENYVATNRMTEDGFRRDYPKPEAQKRALRRVLLAIDADIVVLQEIGDEPYLHELRRDLAKSGLDYPHATLLAAADPDRHQALLSKRPLLAVTPHARLEFPYLGATEAVKRGLLEVRVATSAGELTIFAVHLKSRFTERADDSQSELRRVGEATAIRDVVLARMGDPGNARFVILGDFNDDKASKPVQRLLQRGSVRIASLLPVSDSRGDTWTYHYRRRDSYTRVDHILVSPALAPAVAQHRAWIADLDGVNEASDHRPVVVKLDFAESSP
ncbi:endonuclease/exonuclease/phosphatase family protein [Opitutus terrae]|uniref:Endonuclease/exonuclease/phosphatase n=1 Tax=Opitutus terrae (strain DSM 11246 / JCM 15787 / PB90-1) TaxID=452637 RepID=B1ZW50_OPITP|nr:endonuclease/exonuclease/phosphatase family protein [Opitutus terrae]ACB76064.1 Endonuclease/exonuclease/phosphatase [Opitutus terrae PB90-1]